MAGASGERRGGEVMDFWCFGAACFFAGLALSWLLFWRVLDIDYDIIQPPDLLLQLLDFTMLAAIILIVLNAIRLLGI
jgi:hypothetical protein